MWGVKQLGSSRCAVIPHDGDDEKQGPGNESIL